MISYEFAYNFNNCKRLSILSKLLFYTTTTLLPRHMTPQLLHCSSAEVDQSCSLSNGVITQASVKVSLVAPRYLISTRTSNVLFHSIHCQTHNDATTDFLHDHYGFNLSSVLWEFVEDFYCVRLCFSKSIFMVAVAGLLTKKIDFMCRPKLIYSTTFNNLKI